MDEIDDVEYGVKGLSYEWAVEKAARNHCDIVLADDHTLQLDIDNDAAMQTFSSQHNLLTELGIIDITNEVHATSKNGNSHFTLTLATPMPVERRLLLQALLGSDLKREALSFKRVLLGSPNPILLFRPRAAAKPVSESEPPWVW